MRMDVSTLPAAVAAGRIALTSVPGAAANSTQAKVPAQAGVWSGNKHLKQ
jgi:hypothetical protein